MDPLLAHIKTPADLKHLSRQQLPLLVKELYSAFMDGIAQSGGHFASNLGAIELSIALHYVFSAPNDPIVWDVGHQAYAHKILTGRGDKIHTIRKFGGLAPFPKISESPYDAMGVGHSPTSIGAALGMAIADQLDHKNNHAVAVIGDGAMTAGMAFEALNNAGWRTDLPFLIILNDNEMSISKNLGAFPQFLARNFVQDVKKLLVSVKTKTTPVLKKFPWALDTVQQIGTQLHDLAHETRSSLSLFNDFGFHYTGPIDGHDVLGLVDMLSYLKEQKGPQLLHIHTQKGHGYAPAEKDPIGFHAIKPFPMGNPPLAAAPDKSETFSKVFGDWMVEMGKKDSRLTAITPAMGEGSHLIEFSQAYPERYFDVGIAEQHAVTFAAGLALRGKKPVVAIYSTFLQRAYDQVIHDVVIQNLPVLFAIDRAGIVGADGPTHIGAYDISFMRCLPNIIFATPSDENECRLLLSTCYALDTPTAVRYPRGTGVGVKITHNDFSTVPVGKAIVRRQGKKVALLAFGPLLHRVKELAEKIDATLVDMRFVKPMDEQLIKKLAKTHVYFVTLEENTIKGGAGSAFLEILAEKGLSVKTLLIGLPDNVSEHGSVEEVTKSLNLDKNSVEKRILEFIT